MRSVLTTGVRRALLVPALCLLIVLAGPPAAADGRLEWESLGPWGGFIYRIQVDETNSDRVLAYTTRGNFLSVDRGASWSRLRHPRHPFLGAPVAFSGGRLWVAVDGVLTHSTDNGVTWKPGRKVEGQIVGHARIPGEAPSTIWASVRQEGPQHSSVFVLLPGRETRKIGQMDAIDPRLGNRAALQAHLASPSRLRLILPIFDEGLTWIFGSEDAGASWQQWSVPLWLNAIAPVPGRPDAWVGAAGPVDGRPSGWVRSGDGGRTWKEEGSDARLRKTRTLAFHPTTDALLLGSYAGGVLETPDLGETLLARGEGLGVDDVCCFAFDPQEKDRLYAGTQASLYRSDDGGRSWMVSSTGMTALQSTGIHVLDDNRVLLLEYQQGARVSTDGGRTWLPFEPKWKKAHGKPLWAVARGDTVIANTLGGPFDATVSTDTGRTWIPCEIGKDEWAIGILGSKTFFGARMDRSVLRSRDGVVFETFGTLPPERFGYPIRVFGLGEDRMVILSNTHCASFDPNSGEIEEIGILPEACVPERAVVDPGDPNTLWLGSKSGRLYRRTFPGKLWVGSFMNRSGTFVGLAGDPGRERRRIACFGDGTLLLSENSGKDWVPLDPTRPFRTSVAIAVTPDRRLLVVADGSVRVLDLASLGR